MRALAYEPLQMLGARLGALGSRTLERHSRGLITTALLLAALAGYLAAHRSSSRPVARTLSASAGGVLLNYPASWRAATSGPQIVGLQIAHELVLAPAGEAAQSGLIVGELAGGEPAPLPAQLVASMRHPPRTDIVELLGNQAFRYGSVELQGAARVFTIFAVPESGGELAVLACYAPAAASLQLRACERIAATATLVNQSQSYDLTPSQPYAGRLHVPLAVLQEQRLSLRRQMATSTTPQELQTAATHLAADLAAAVAAISAIEPPPYVAHAQAALAGSLQRAQRAYGALATAAATGEQEPMGAARALVYAAEPGIDSALENFALLGYKQG